MKVNKITKSELKAVEQIAETISSPVLSKALINLYTLLDNCADPDAKTLEYSPTIIKAESNEDAVILKAIQARRKDLKGCKNLTVFAELEVKNSDMDVLDWAFIGGNDCYEARDYYINKCNLMPTIKDSRFGEEQGDFQTVFDAGMKALRKEMNK